jgi:hypothetical protein
MSRHRVRVAAVGLGLLAAVGAALAQSSSATFNVPRQSVDGGAQRTTSATYSANATVGQPDAGPTSSSATYGLRGGFHLAATAGPLPDSIFSNGFEP